jgi:hypothetical protein
MLNPELDNFYLQQEEPNQSCFLALRDLILDYDSQITPDFKYGLPFFMYKGKMFCYLWKDKKANQPYISIAAGNKINHPALFQGDRKRFKLLYINAEEDLPVKRIWEILELARATY